MEGLQPGRIVYFVFDDHSAAEVNRRRSPSDVGTARWPAAAQAHVGNIVRSGDHAPAMVVRVWTEGTVNLKVMLDGSDEYWVTSVRFDEHGNPRTWHNSGL